MQAITTVGFANHRYRLYPVQPVIQRNYKLFCIMFVGLYAKFLIILKVVLGGQCRLKKHQASGVGASPVGIFNAFLLYKGSPGFGGAWATLFVMAAPNFKPDGLAPTPDGIALGQVPGWARQKAITENLPGFGVSGKFSPDENILRVPGRFHRAWRWRR